MKKILASSLCFAMLYVFSGSFEDELYKAEIWAQKKYPPGSLAYHSITQKLFVIQRSSKPESEKIAELHQKFPEAYDDNAAPQQRKNSGVVLKTTPEKPETQPISNNNQEDFVKQLQKAAKQGNAKAQYDLGVYYAKGLVVERNHTEALKWFRKAAEQKNAAAQYVLSRYFHAGVYVKQDYSEAVKWCRKAADHGYPDAQFVLGEFYAQGVGVSPDYSEAVKWYRKAAEQGHLEAQRLLALCYHYGKGVKQDPVEAEKWMLRARENLQKQNIKALSEMMDSIF